MRLSIPVPRPPGSIPDPLRRVGVPKALSSVTTVGEESDPLEVGMDAERVAKIWSGVEDLYRTGVHPAIALCVRREGEVIIDRAIGHARGNGPGDPDEAPKVPATPETPFVIYSASKSVTAMVAHLLDERREIHLADRVCEYIPEYGRHGKDVITITHVLAHRAGVPNLPREAFDLDLLDDPDHLLQLLCDAKPSTRPGRMLSYHAVSGGFIVAEIVRRVTGREIDDVLREEILEPLGFRWGNFGVRADDLPAVARNYVTGPRVLPPVSTLLKRALGVSSDEIVDLSNDPRFLTGVVPSANTVTTANELSRFYELLRRGGELDGIRIFEPRTIRRATTEQSYLEFDLTLGFPSRYSTGFILGAKLLSLYGPDTDRAFGHLGYTNMLGWADPERALSVGLMTSGKPILYPELPEFWNLARRIGSEAPKVGVSALAF
jgi:CubicO group peptidase (beta-lactamase class C family)